MASLGNGNEEVIQAMTEQARRMAYAYHQSLGNESADKLADWLCARSEGALVAGAFFNSGQSTISTYTGTTSVGTNGYL